MNWLKEKRVDKLESTYTASKNIGISQSLLSHIENGRRKPSVVVAKKIANYFGFNWNMFFE